MMKMKAYDPGRARPDRRKKIMPTPEKSAMPVPGNRTMPTRRKRAAVLAAVLALLLAIGGTLTYTNFIQNAKNEFEGDTFPGVRLHDDFDEPNKDVYVENYGDVVNYVRIRLDEYMEIEDIPLVPGTAKDDTGTWVPHIPATTVAVDPEEFHNYWTWKMGGQKWYLPTDNRDDTSPDADQNNNVYDSESTDTNASGAGVTQTRDATVLTMADWMLGGSVAGDFWVYDVDGWAYWASPLGAGDATGLLLDQVDPAYPPENTYYYGINVLLQAATAIDFDKFETDGRTITDNAKELLRKIAARPEVTGVTITQGVALTAAPGETLQLNAVVNPAETAPQGVRWVIEGADEDYATINAKGLVTVSANAAIGDIYTITAYSTADIRRSAAATLRVQ